MLDFLEVASYLGFKDFEVDTIAKLARRIFKEP